MQSSQRLLVVEDDVTVARALSRTLARRGFSVVIARSCAAARALDQRFDFAVLDLDLPDGNGVDLARDLIASTGIPNIVFFTGSHDGALLARARRLGGVVMKSAGTPELLALLSHESGTSEAPQSRTSPRAKARGFRPASGSAITAGAAHAPAAHAPVRKSRAR